MSVQENPLPDYYAILQVHPEAEEEVIRAAYRMLMRKYHPDSLLPEQRQNIELLKRVRSINMAYDVLSDHAQRAAYDLSLKRQSQKASVLSTPGLDTRIHLVRCAKMGKTYKMLLARRAGSSRLFRVTGFELVEVHTPVQMGSDPDELRLLLPGGLEKPNPLKALLKKVLPAPKKQSSGPAPKFPDQSELKDLFAVADSLSFGEIDWAGFNCPACHTEFRFTDGGNASWCHCSACSRIYCAGNLHNTLAGVYSHCPWCGRLAKITLRLRPGEQADMPVHGEVERSEGTLPQLKDSSQKRLPEKKV